MSFFDISELFRSFQKIYFFDFFYKNFWNLEIRHLVGPIILSNGAGITPANLSPIGSVVIV